MSSDLRAILKERDARYGSLYDHACISQSLKATLHATDKWKGLPPDSREALEMIVHKIGRILNGDPEYTDSWSDIAGYAQLVVSRIDKENMERTKRKDV